MGKRQHQAQTIILRETDGREENPK